jgi:hypothetical protein
MKEPIYKCLSVTTGIYLIIFLMQDTSARCCVCCWFVTESLSVRWKNEGLRWHFASTGDKKYTSIFVCVLNSWLLLTGLWLSIKLCLFYSNSIRILGAFRLDSKSTYYLRHICLSAFITAAPSGRISVKFDTGAFMKPFWQLQIRLKSDKNMWHFIWSPNDV